MKGQNFVPFVRLHLPGVFRILLLCCGRCPAVSGHPRCKKRLRLQREARQGLGQLLVCRRTDKEAGFELFDIPSIH
jgi:hypothetical protein